MRQIAPSGLGARQVLFNNLVPVSLSGVITMATPKVEVQALVDGCIVWFKLESASESAAGKAETAIDRILIPAIKCGDLKAWDNMRTALDNYARISTKSIRTKMGYEQVDRKGSGGNITVMTVPVQTLANIFSVIRQTYKRSLEFNDKRGNALAFNKLKINKAKAVEKENKAATGRKKDMLRLREVCNAIVARAKNVKDDTELHNLVNRIATDILKPMPTSKAA